MSIHQLANWYNYEFKIDMEVDFLSGSCSAKDGGVAKPQVDGYENQLGFGTVDEQHSIFAPFTCGFLSGVLSP